MTIHSLRKLFAAMGLALLVGTGVGVGIHASAWVFAHVRWVEAE